MAKKTKVIKHDPMAKALALGQYQPKKIVSKKVYKRKPKHKSTKEI